MCTQRMKKRLEGWNPRRSKRQGGGKEVRLVYGLVFMSRDVVLRDGKVVDWYIDR